MFTGIIEERGEVLNIHGTGRSFTIHIKAQTILEDIKIGDSISTNGVCLTVTEYDRQSFKADVMPETFERTSLHQLKRKEVVNLERAMRLGDRFGGHIVSGHIDGTASIEGFRKDENATWVTLKASENILKYILMKGSVALDGISLTVADCDKETFKVSIIPETARETTLLSKKPGDLINVECDIVGKYIERLMQFAPQAQKEDITQQLLAENGFV